MVSDEVLEQLKRVNTDSVWWILDELGYPDTFMAGLTVLPGDVLVGDIQGVIVIPAGLAAEVAERALELEDMEEYIKQRLVETDVPIHEIYPPNEATYEAYKASRGGSAPR